MLACGVRGCYGSQEEVKGCRHAHLAHATEPSILEISDFEGSARVRAGLLSERVLVRRTEGLLPCTSCACNRDEHPGNVAKVQRMCYTS